MVLVGRGPMGAGMEEVYQVTSALKYLDARQAGGAADGRAVLGRLDRRRASATSARKRSAAARSGECATAIAIRVVIDRNRLEGRSIWSTVTAAGETVAADAEIARRAPRADLAPDAALPDDTRLWAALQHVSGGTWGGCVYDVDAIVAALETGR